MTWEKGRVRDGDPIYYVEGWREELERRKYRDARSLGERLLERKELKEDEVMLKHPTNGALIRLKDDGAIEIMSEGSGVRISSKGVEVIGPSFIISSKTMHLFNEGRGVYGEDISVRPKRTTTIEEVEKWKGGQEDVD